MKKDRKSSFKEFLTIYNRMIKRKVGPWGRTPPDFEPDSEGKIDKFKDSW